MPRATSARAAAERLEACLATLDAASIDTDSDLVQGPRGTAINGADLKAVLQNVLGRPAIKRKAV